MTVNGAPIAPSTAREEARRERRLAALEAAVRRQVCRPGIPAPIAGAGASWGYMTQAVAGAASSTTLTLGTSTKSAVLVLSSGGGGGNDWNTGTVASIPTHASGSGGGSGAILVLGLNVTSGRPESITYTIGGGGAVGAAGGDSTLVVRLDGVDYTWSLTGGGAGAIPSLASSYLILQRGGIGGGISTPNLPLSTENDFWLHLPFRGITGKDSAMSIGTTGKPPTGLGVNGAIQITHWIASVANYSLTAGGRGGDGINASTGGQSGRLLVYEST
jgi:hypothetical protein